MSEQALILFITDLIDLTEDLQVLSSSLLDEYVFITALYNEKVITEIIANPLPELIILDGSRANSQGLQICRSLKEDLRTCKIPVIGLINSGDWINEKCWFEAGVADCLYRPLQVAPLLARIQGQLALIKQRDIEIKLNELKARFTRFTNRLKDRFIFFTHAPDGTLFYLSEGVNLLGFKQPEQVLGESWIELISGTRDSLDRNREENRKLLTGEQNTVEFEVTYHHPDGQDRVFMLYEHLSYDPQSRPLIEGIAVDITAQRSQELKLQTLLRAVERAPVSIVVTDPAGSILYVNPYFSLVTGYTESEALGQNPRVLKSGEQDSKVYKILWETITAGHTWRGELVNKKRDGTLYWEAATISPILDEGGRIVNFVAIKEDISDRKTLERVKEEVDRIMRHDLKSPLNAIVGFPQVLEQDSNLTSIQRNTIRLIREAGQKLLDMIDLSLDLFKMETGIYQYVPNKIDFLIILNQVIKFAEPRLKVKKITVQMMLDDVILLPEQRFWIHAEARLLFSLLSNLFINAVEASPISAIIELNIINFNQKVPQFCMQNQGAVPLAVRNRFFEKYRTYGKKGGTGLGTYSAKLLADTMGLDLRMETSDEENRTWIWLSLITAN